MIISINLTDKRYSLKTNRIRKLAMRVLKSESGLSKNVSIVYCKDKEITALNKKFKGKSCPTDVLAFELSDANTPDFLGEIYVDLEQAKRQAFENKVPYAEEIERLTIHGLLHLLGYKDDNKKNRQKMWAQQEDYLRNGKKRRR